MNRIYLEKILNIVRLLLITIAVVIAFWLFSKDFVGGGVLVLKNDFQLKDSQISVLYPDVRVREPEQDENEDWYQNMYVDPVYFKVNLPREFDKVRLRIKYRTNRQPYFQVGVKAGPGELDFEFFPLEFQKLDKLDWDKVSNDELTLYQKTKRFASIEEFLDDLPRDGRIALYNLDLEIPDRERYILTILNSKTDLDHVSYILTDYREPEIEGIWKIGETEFEISRENFELGKLIFIFSAPELDINKGDIDISEIVVVLERPRFRVSNLFSEFGEYLRSVVDK